MLISHPPLSTDSFTLYIKGSILLGKIKTFNVRYKIRTSDVLNASPPDGNSPDSGSGQADPRESIEFQMLDRLVGTFIARIPKEFKDPFAVGEGTTRVDPVLYSALLLPHVSALRSHPLHLKADLESIFRSMILLHDPHAKLSSPGCISSSRILTSIRAILDLIYNLCATTYDLLQLEHSCSFCWFIAGAALTRFLKAKIDAGDEAEVLRMTGELQALKWVSTSHICSVRS